MVKIVLFIFQRFKVMDSKPSMKDRPWNSKKPWVKKDHKPQKLSPSKKFKASFPGRVLTLPVKFHSLTKLQTRHLIKEERLCMK